MLNSQMLDDLVKKLSAALPPSMREIQDEARDKFRDAIQSTFSQLDLVTREEFDVQCKVLARTRVQLEAMEQQIASLEEQLASTKKPAAKSKASKKDKK